MRTRLAAAIGHALRFDTWRSLAHVEGLDDAGAADLMVDLARAAAPPEAPPLPAAPHARRDSPPAVILGTRGQYGVLTYIVAERTREIAGAWRSALRRAGSSGWWWGRERQRCWSASILAHPA